MVVQTSLEAIGHGPTAVLPQINVAIDLYTQNQPEERGFPHFQLYFPEQGSRTRGWGTRSLVSELPEDETLESFSPRNDNNDSTDDDMPSLIPIDGSHDL